MLRDVKWYRICMSRFKMLRAVVFVKPDSTSDNKTYGVAPPVQGGHPTDKHKTFWESFHRFTAGKQCNFLLFTYYLFTSRVNE